MRALLVRNAHTFVFRVRPSIRRAFFPPHVKRKGPGGVFLKNYPSRADGVVARSSHFPSSRSAVAREKRSLAWEYFRPNITRPNYSLFFVSSSLYVSLLSRRETDTTR